MKQFLKTGLPALALLFYSATLAAQQNDGLDRIKVYTRKQDSVIEFYASNAGLVPFQLEVSFARLVGLEPSRQLPLYLVLQPGEKETYLFSLKRIDATKPASYKLLTLVSPGDPRKAVHDDTQVYLLPFEHGTKHKLAQGYNGSTSHRAPSNFSLDFMMPQGTKVLAARDGLVIRVREDSRRGGPSKRFVHDANEVEIYHDDGTIAKYVHLQPNGALVDVGDRVKAGQVIGLSGNTGWSSGPHLHFEVIVPIRNSYRSVPTTFRGRDGEAFQPGEGVYYYAYHPGGPEFEEVLGANLTDADFANHKIAVNPDGRIELRDAREDDTIILFLRNGFETAREFTIKLNLVNLRTSRPMPVVLRVPASTEVFLTLLRPIDATRATSFTADDVIMRKIPALTGGGEP